MNSASRMPPVNRRLTKASIWKFGRNRPTVAGSASSTCSTRILLRRDLSQVNPRVKTRSQLDQLACVAGGLVGVGLFEFRRRDGEDCAFDDVIRVAREFKIAMIRSAAADDEVVIVDADDLQSITNECVT